MTTSIRFRVCQLRFPEVKRLFSFIRIPVRTVRYPDLPNRYAAHRAFCSPNSRWVPGAGPLNTRSTLPLFSRIYNSLVNQFAVVPPATGNSKDALHPVTDVQFGLGISCLAAHPGHIFYFNFIPRKSQGFSQILRDKSCDASIPWGIYCYEDYSRSW